MPTILYICMVLQLFFFTGHNGGNKSFCTNNVFAFNEMKMIQFNVLLQTFANILINTKGGKKEKCVGRWVKKSS